MAAFFPRLYLLGRYEDRRNVVMPAGELTHVQELNGEDAIEFDYRWGDDAELFRYDRILWQDENSDWHEHVVAESVLGERGVFHIFAENSASEMLRDYIEEQTLSGVTATAAVNAALAQTRWVLDACDLTGSQTLYLYHTNVLAALYKIADAWGGELTFGIDVDAMGVTRRWVRLQAQRGANRGAIFDMGRNAGNFEYTERTDEIYTALYGYGAGLPVVDEGGTWTGGYRRKLTFGEINGGLDYVADETAKARYGRWNADKSAKVHAFGEVNFPNCTDKTRLLALTQAALADNLGVREMLEMDVSLIDCKLPVRLGDTVSISDAQGWCHVHGRQFRVKRMVTTYGEGVRTHVVLGGLPTFSYSAQASMATRMAAVEDCAGYASDQSTSNTQTATGLEENIEELQNDVAVLPTSTDVDEAIAAALEELDQLNEVDF